MSIRVYYLDDEPALCQIFGLFFEDSDIEVSTFLHADAAMEAVYDRPPDLMFIDYRLSDRTGVEVAKELPLELPKVLITGDLTVPYHELFETVVPKPFEFDKIEQLIRSIVAG